MIILMSTYFLDVYILVQSLFRVLCVRNEQIALFYRPNKVEHVSSLLTAIFRHEGSSEKVDLCTACIQKQFVLGSSKFFCLFHTGFTKWSIERNQPKYEPGLHLSHVYMAMCTLFTILTPNVELACGSHG